MLQRAMTSPWMSPPSIKSRNNLIPGCLFPAIDRAQRMISLTRPTAPLSRRTLMPCGWEGDLVRISFTTPSVRLPDRWSFFNTIRTVRPVVKFIRRFPSIVPTRPRSPAKPQASGSPLEGDSITVFEFMVYIALCPALSIDGADGKKRADCLSPPTGGGVSACSGRNDDAQDKAGHGRFLLLRFLLT